MSGVENINRKNYCDGMRDAIPIALGYLAVAFTLGIAARNAGVHVLPATIMSLTNTTSAGEFAAITAIAGGVGYAELALMQLVINLRYMLMSCALTQKLDPKFSIIHRFFIGFGVTDEIFGKSVLHVWRDVDCDSGMDDWHLSRRGAWQCTAGRCG